MKYKVGDKLLCKCTTTSENYISDRWYEIMGITTYSCIVVSEPNTTFNFCFYFDNYDQLIENRHWHVYDYFYTMEEVRQRKLERLKQCIM